MKNDTKRIKRTNQVLKGLFFEGFPLGEIADIMDVAKNQFDQMMSQIKLIMVECLLSRDRESLFGPDDLPIEGWQKWEYQRGFVYVSGERVPAQMPRLRKNGKEREGKGTSYLREFKR